MSRLSKRAINLTAEKQALLEVLLREEGVESSALQKIPRRKNLGPVPLSYAQQRLWFLDQLAPANSAYNIADAIHLTGHLDVICLQNCLSEIIARHESLRTRFITVDGSPLQLINQPQPLLLPIVDLSALEPSDQKQQALRLANDEGQRGFDLQRGPLIRARVLRLQPDSHIVLLTMHHIISDGWSMEVLVREVTTLYDRRAKGDDDRLEELPIQYADYALWQREYMQGERLEEQLKYWREQLAGAAPLLELPTDRPRPAIQSFEGASLTIELDEEMSRGLRELSKREGVTLYMTMLSAYKVLLYRMSGQRDIVVGTPTAGRTRVELEPLIGFFVNTLAMRSRMEGSMSFEEMMRREKEVVLGAFGHQDVPFERVVEEMEPERSVSYSPIFQVMFDMESRVERGEGLGGRLGEMKVEGVESEWRRSKFDLTLSLSDTHQGLEMTWEYSTDLFDGATIERMTECYKRLLEGVVKDARQKISEIEILSEVEKRHLLEEWNETEREYAEDSCIHQLFEQQAQATPDSIAVASEDGTLTYAELNSRANQLAHYLRRQGVGPELLVHICLERSPEMILGLLGVLKAGGAYVPLDLAYPDERLELILASDPSPILLTHQRLAGRFSQSRTKFIYLDRDWQQISTEVESDVVSEVNADDLAYMIYTSGSTGVPKGVGITHKSLMNLVEWHQRTYGCEASDRATQIAGPAFDASVWEIWPYLTIGASIHIASEETRLSAPKLKRWLNEKQITICFLPTPLAENVLQEEMAAEQPLRAMLVGGDRLKRPQRSDYGFKLFNHYGPTESTVVTTQGAVECSEEIEAQSPDIGRPIWNTRVYIVDGNGKAVPVGVAGELNIAGRGLARGYYNWPEKTAEKFVPNAFSDKAGSRLYKTGDLVRYDSKGNIHFIGRTDNQVKIRGVRIELGEIEEALRQHDDVREVVALARESVSGGNQLAAYVVSKQEASLTVSELRGFLSGKLPEYMIPQGFVMLEEVPLTPAGKVDRRALSSLKLNRAELEKGYVAPRTELEDLLAHMWRQILGIEELGVHDNFFELGGDSIRGAIFINRLQEKLGETVYVVALFDAPNVAELAVYLTQQYPQAVARVCGIEPADGDKATDGKELIQIKRMPRDADAKYPLSFAQQRLWFLNQLEPNSHFYNIPLVVRLVGNLRVKELEKSFNEIIRRHEVLRTTFAVVDAQPVQVIAPELKLTLPIIDLSQMASEYQEAEVERLASQQVREPFDLEKGPLLRASLVQLNENDHVVMITMHHIASDEWSMEALVREVAVLYDSLSQGKPSSLPDLPIQYADFAVWQREYLQGELLDEHLSYWKRQLAGAPPVLELPTDRPRPSAQSYGGASSSIELGERLSRRLKQLSQQENMTLFMTLLAAYRVFLYRVSGERDIVVGTPITGRTRVELEELIGFFVNTLAMRVKLEGRMGFKDVMRKEREAVVGGYRHQEVPFERVVEEMQPERSLSYSPIFQVAFNFMNATSKPEISLPELSLTSLGGNIETSKFDLVMVIMEAEHNIFVDLRYSTDLFNESTIERMLTYFQRLIEAAVADPQQPIQALPMLTEAEARQLIFERNDTSSPYPTRDFVHHLFEHQASIRPDAAALVSESRLLTYDELNRRANQVANYLRSLGVGPETLVGVCMKGSMEMVIATLGILKAGGAYIPLDPAYPTMRLALMIEESMMPVLLTQQNLEEQLPVHWGQVTLLDSDWEVIEQHSRENPASDINPENLAYVIYTSGSTGKPKGVQINHEALLNMIYWYQQNFAVTPADRATQVAGVAFDASVWEVWPCLTAGASIHFPNEEIRILPLQLRDWLVSKGITISFLPTPLAEIILSFDWPKDVALRILQTAGDKLHRHPSRPLPFNLVNNYGPTENTVVATSGPVPVRPQESAAPSIGRPIHNTQLYLLDPNLQLVPDGARGEMYIGGSSLARGYLFQPDVTAERFVPDEFGGRPGARLYKTGDLVRYLADGNIEFLGRVDDQVKVRGFRIELGDIEAALSQHAALQDSIVIAREDAPGEIRLVAYLVCKADQAPSASAMRAYLKERLPEYMTPQAFVTLDALPLTPNGKVDRKALPAPDQSRPHPDRDFAAPRNELERFLADKWREVLGIEEIGIYDNFFEAGGESLKVAVLINTLQQELGEVLQVVSIFDAPNIAAFADYLKKDCPDAVSRFLGNEPRQEKAPAVIEKIDSDKVALLRQLINPLPPKTQYDRAAATKNPPAIFVLSSPRSGSTLLRVMMGGHPRLFAPPELELLSFNTLEERRAAFSGRDSFWLEGAIRAVMEIKGCDAEEAKNIIEVCEEQKLTTQQFYGLMQEWLADRMLVDKSPSYAMNLEILNRAETDFEGALFIHLIRSPQGMIRSYEEAKLDQIFPRFKHPFSAREVAELVWVISCQNILKFLSRVPQERQHRVKFEELVSEPESVTRGICQFLGIEFDSRMLQPYKDQEKKMTNGIHTVSRMLGDVKFHQHSGIDSAVAESWKEYYPEDFLGEITLELAESLGYKEEKTEPRLYIDELFERPSLSSPLVAIQPSGSNRPFFCAHPGGGNVLCYVDLARHLGSDQPFYAFQARGLNGEHPACTSIEEMATLYLESMRTVQPEGPYLLGGWSMGGVIAFEMARQLEAQGEQIDMLVLMDARAPNYNEDLAEEDDLAALASFSQHLGLEPERINISFEHFLSLGLNERLAYFMEEAKSAGLMPSGITLSQIQHLFEVFKANGTAMINYVPGMVGCKIVLLTASDRLADIPQRLVTGWNELTEKDVEIIKVPGNHFTMIREPYIRFAAERLKSRIYETVAS